MSNIRPFLSCIVISLSPQLLAAQWDATASAIAMVEYSDNVDQTERGEEDVILSLTPGFGLTGKGKQADLNLRYDVRGQHYVGNTKDHEFFHNFLGRFDYRAIPNRLNFNAEIVVEQELEDLSRGLIPDYVTGSDNLITVGRYRLGMDYLQPLANYGQLSFIAGVFLTDESGGDQDTKGYDFQISGQDGTEFKQGLWNFSYSQGYQKPNDAEYSFTQLADATLGYSLNQYMALMVNFFWEENDIQESVRQENLDSASWGPGLRFSPSDRTSFEINYNFSLKDTNDDYWGGKLSWVPTGRTSLKASYGKRFFGDAYDVQFSHRIKRLSNSITYQESIESYSTEVYNASSNNTGSLICPAGPILDLTQCEFSNEVNPDVAPDKQVITFYTPPPAVGDELYLSKAANWSSTLRSGKSTYTLNLFYTQRLYFTEVKDEDDYGLSFNWGIKVGRKTSLQLGAQWRELEENLGNSGFVSDETEQRYNINLNHKLSARSFMVLGYLFTERDGSTSDYDENRLQLSYQVVY